MNNAAYDALYATDPLLDGATVPDPSDPSGDDHAAERHRERGGGRRCGSSANCLPIQTLTGLITGATASRRSSATARNTAITWPERVITVIIQDAGVSTFPELMRVETALTRGRPPKGGWAAADHTSMAVYAYSAINAQGAELEGTLQASDLATALEQLRQNGLLAQKIDEVRDADTSGSASSGAFKGVKSKSLQIFSRQFATMIEAGLNVVGALLILEEQTSDRNLSAVVGQLPEDVEGGPCL